MVTILDDGDVQVDDVAVLEHLAAWHAVADLVVDRSADRLGVGRVARGGIIQRGRNAALHVDHVVMAQGVEFLGRDAGFDEGRDVVEHFPSQPSGQAHAFDIFRCF